MLAYGQERGSVSVHTDPRLSLLINKTKASELNKPVANATVAPKTGKIKTPRTSVPADIKETKELKTIKETAAGKGSREEVAKTTTGKVTMPAKNAEPKVALAATKTSATKSADPKKDKDVKPARKAFLTESHGPHYTGPGFRVQIYNGPDRTKALRVKSEFMSRNPGVHTYLIYASPCYKVKAGDFRKRDDAEGMYKDANTLFSPCMIVPDEVTINSN